MTGSTMQTFTGRRFDFTAPDAADLSILDIAHALALTNRFGGHTREPYSVAEHSVRVAYRAMALCDGNHDAARAGHLHDAAEAFVGDLVRPLKHRVDFASFGWLEKRIDRLVCERFGIPAVAFAYQDVVHRAARELLHTEARDLFPGGARGDWTTEALPAVIEPRPWPQAERWFLETFQWLFPSDREVSEVRARLRELPS